MNFIRSLFSSSPEQQARWKVQKYLSTIGLYSKNLALSLTFMYQLNLSIDQSPSATIYIRQLVRQLSKTPDVSSTVKLFTIIHNCIYERNYNREQIEALEDIPKIQIENQEEKKWFEQFCHSYSSYLKKLPSVSDVYKRAKIAKIETTQHSNFLIEVFRIINQVALLFPSICSLANNIGRYYITVYPEFPEFYRILSKEITMLYNYLKLMIEEILGSYRQFNSKELKCFIKTIPEIELTSDKIEDLLLNKYFKAKAIKGKIFFREEKVQELSYYLNYELEGKILEVDQQGQTLQTDIRRDQIWERNN